MARFPYDVNTTRRYIDVNKQFNGGLKTIDTDDSLGAVFLRQAENVSLSEFGFIEKRYGTYEKEEIQLTRDNSGTIETVNVTTTDKIQGFWQYGEKDGTVNEIIIVSGKLYLKKQGETAFLEINTFKKEGEFKYDESIIASSVIDSAYGENFDLTFTNGEAYRPDTGELDTTYSSDNLRARTDKINLLDIEGFNPLNKLQFGGFYGTTLNYPSYSYAAFWDASGTYLGYYGSPRLNEYDYDTGTGTETVEISDRRLGFLPRRRFDGSTLVANSQTVPIPEGAAEVALVLDNTTYTDDNGATRYVWGQGSTIPYSGGFFSFSGNSNITDTIGIYKHTLTTGDNGYYPFQATKEIQAAQVKDSLFIFTGSYPIYYKGGDTFFIFPIYRPNNTDVANAGHNYLETRSFEEVYGHSGDLYELNNLENFEDPSLDYEDLEENEGADGFPITPRLSFTKKEFYPKLPFAVQNQKKGELTFELNYNYGEELGKAFDPWEYGDDSRPENYFKSPDYTNVNYNLKLKDISYAGAGSSSANEYVKIKPENITTRGTFSNFTGVLNTNNASYTRGFVRNADSGLFTDLKTEGQINQFPGPSHGQAAFSSAPNTSATDRHFIGDAVQSPFGIDALYMGLNDYTLAISIEDEIIRTKDTGNLAGQKFAFRFKRQEVSQAQSVSSPNYESFDFNDVIQPSGVYGALVSTIPSDANTNQSQVDKLNKFLSRRMVVVIKPVIGNNILVEDKTQWQFLYNTPGQCYYNNLLSRLEFTMPEFPDRIDNEPITAYKIDLKTIDRYKKSTVLGLELEVFGGGSSAFDEKYKENYNGKAMRSINCRGTDYDDSTRGLRTIYPGLKGGRTKFDYNLIAIETDIPESSVEDGFGEKIIASVSELIPGNYDFKLTFSVDENEVEIIHPWGQDAYQGDFDSSETYSLGDYVKYGTDSNANPVYYKSLENNNHNHQPNTSTTKWEVVDFEESIEEDTNDIGRNKAKTTQQFINIYFRNIEITTNKITDYNSIREDGKSPLLSCTKVTEHYGKLIVYGSEEKPDTVFVSFPDNFSYFPSLFSLDFTTPTREPIQSVVPFMDVLVVQTETMTWGIRGSSPLVDSPEPYARFMITPSYGTIAPKSVQVVRNKLFFLSHLGVVSLHSLYAVDQQYNVKHEDTIVNNIIPQDKEAVAIQYDNQYWLNFPNYGITLRWYANKNSWVQDKFGGYIDSNGTHQTSNYGWDQMNGVFKWESVGDGLEFITKPSRFEDSGNTHIYRIAIDKKLPTDLYKPIVAKFETSFLNQNYPFHPKNYKEAKLDFTLQNQFNQSRDSVYTMADADDITGNSTHFIDNVSVVANHFYKVQYDFTPQYTVVDGGSYNPHDSDVTVIDGGSFETNSYDIVGNILFGTIDGVTYDETFSHLDITGAAFRKYDDPDVVIPVNAQEIGDDYVIFQLPYGVIADNQFDITITGNFENYSAGASMFDVTYDDSLTFKTWVISEDRTLNLDNIDSYEQAKADIDFSLGTRLGTWVFGTSDFGNKITAVKTIKLSGKGYNAKLYFEDFTKSKWTLESMGLTYKMKRARSR
jgi:hypothetical protein